MEMAQQLRLFVIFVEDPSSVPNIQVRWLTSTYQTLPESIDPLTHTHKQTRTYAHMHTHTMYAPTDTYTKFKIIKLKSK